MNHEDQGLPLSVVPPDSSATARPSSGLSNPNMTDQEKKERFLMFTRVLMKYLEQRDAKMHLAAKSIIKECYEKNKSGDPQFKCLTTIMEARLRSTVGESYWKKAHNYLDHFLKQKRLNDNEVKQRAALQVQQGQAMQQGGKVVQVVGQPQIPTSHPSQMSVSMHGGVPLPIVRTSAPRPSATTQQQQQQHPMTQSQIAAAAATRTPIAATSSRPAPSTTTNHPPAPIPVSLPTTANPMPTNTAQQPPLMADQLKAREAEKKEAEQAKRKLARKAQARAARAARKKEKDRMEAIEIIALRVRKKEKERMKAAAKAKADKASQAVVVSKKRKRLKALPEEERVQYKKRAGELNQLEKEEILQLSCGDGHKDAGGDKEPTQDQQPQIQPEKNVHDQHAYQDAVVEKEVQHPHVDTKEKQVQQKHNVETMETMVVQEEAQPPQADDQEQRAPAQGRQGKNIEAMLKNKDAPGNQEQQAQGQQEQNMEAVMTQEDADPRNQEHEANGGDKEPTQDQQPQIQPEKNVHDQYMDQEAVVEKEVQHPQVVDQEKQVQQEHNVEAMVVQEEAQHLQADNQEQQAPAQGQQGKNIEDVLAQEDAEPPQVGNQEQPVQAHGQQEQNVEAVIAQEDTEPGHPVAIKQEESDDEEIYVSPRFYYFRVVISNNDTNTVIRVPRRQDLTFEHLRHEIAEDAVLPFTSFQFTLEAGGVDRVTPNQERKWHVSDMDFDLTNQGDGSRRYPYRVYIEEAE